MSRSVRSASAVAVQARSPVTPPRALEIERKPALAAQVTERLREAIVFGQLHLGEAISEDRLATMLGVSRTPVREALGALQLQGLISILPQRGSFVFQPTEQDVAELCEFRAMVEIHALRLAHARQRAATIAGLTAAQQAIEAADVSGDITAAARSDAAFHNTLFAHCGNQILVQSYSLASGRVGAITFVARGSRSSRKASNAGHWAVIKAFEAGDLPTAEAILTEHILNMRAHFVEAMRLPATAITD
jgi:DNA-binding GntR family transcriptional regulator